MIPYIDMHAHMVSRTTDDYRQMAMTGCVAITEPAFWAGWDRSTPEGFEDYFRQLTDFESKRAAEYGIRHYAWLCINPKEGHDRSMAQRVIERIPKFLDHPDVLGIGEIGLNKNTTNELATFRDHVNLAMEHEQLILIHTPHLEDKKKGTRLIIEALQSDSRVDPSRVLIDHAEEHTIEMILDAGFWAGMTLYPVTKATPARAADLVEQFGPERLVVSSACDWGESAPMGVPNFIFEMRKRGHDDSLIQRMVFGNQAAFLSQCSKFVTPRVGGWAEDFAGID